jgi:hypothetical protein
LLSNICINTKVVLVDFSEDLPEDVVAEVVELQEREGALEQNDELVTVEVPLRRLAVDGVSRKTHLTDQVNESLGEGLELQIFVVKSIEALTNQEDLIVTQLAADGQKQSSELSVSVEQRTPLHVSMIQLAQSFPNEFSQLAVTLRPFRLVVDRWWSLRS